MNPFWAGVIVGAVLGGTVGILLTCLVSIAGQNDEASARLRPARASGSTMGAARHTSVPGVPRARGSNLHMLSNYELAEAMAYRSHNQSPDGGAERISTA